MLPPRSAHRLFPLRLAVSHLLATLVAIPAALWIIRHENIIQRHGRALASAEFKFATRIGIAHPEAIRILALPRIPSPFGGLLAPLEDRIGFSLARAAGVTLGYGIYLAKTEESLALVSHELVHVRQYERLGGPLPFIRQYFLECLSVGYHNAPLEREAVELAGS